MKYNKLKAFTLAEVMILLLTLSILMAAFAPVFTRRYTGAAIDNVWTYVPADSNYDAYYNVIGESLKAQAFIGLTPTDKLDVQIFTTDDSNHILNSKLVIAAANHLQIDSNNPQKHIQFRFGSDSGALAGVLFAGNQNILVGGKYLGLSDSSKRNTSFGANALNYAGRKTYNDMTVIGFNAFNGDSDSDKTTIIGTNSAISPKHMNTLVGFGVARNATNIVGNTAIGNNSLADAATGSVFNTALGHDTLKSTNGSYNVALGHNSLENLASGSGNTAIGYKALTNLISGSYNTAIGFNSCGLNAQGSYITCIGARTGSEGEPNSNYFKGNNVDDGVVLIGTFPKISPTPDWSETQYGTPAAVLEVHNRKTKNPNGLPSNGAGNESVVVNGNLIVRGSSYFEVPLFRASNIGTDEMDVWWAKQYGDGSTDGNNSGIPKGLVAFNLINTDDYFEFAGVDGARRNGLAVHYCGRRYRCHEHAFDTNRENCICTIVAGANAGSHVGKCAPSSTILKRVPQNTPSKSYDWFSKSDNDNGTHKTCHDDGTRYTDKSFNCKVELEHWMQYATDADKESGHYSPGVDVPYAHLSGILDEGQSCCPNLSPDMSASSDRRLKNIGEKFTAGLDEIRKLNIYNYTYKNDSNKLPNVGVIAQELKLIFPTAVAKDKNGFYRIRWDEMFYAAINSIKTLNNKIEALASKIAADNDRIAILKKENSELNNKLDKLEDELTQLEAKKRK